jgi:hypothetical protein
MLITIFLKYWSIKINVNRTQSDLSNEVNIYNKLKAHSPPWQANISLAFQEIPPPYMNPKLHYRFHKSPPLDPVLRKKNPIHSIISFL